MSMFRTVVIALMLTGCTHLQNLILEQEVYKERLSRCYLFEVYQNGNKIDEVCLNEFESFSEEGIYYKKTDK